MMNTFRTRNERKKEKKTQQQRPDSSSGRFIMAGIELAGGDRGDSA